MHATAKVVLLCAMIGALYAAHVERPSSLPPKARDECTSHSDCPPSSCCTIQEERYSRPHCLAQPEEGDSCRPTIPRILNTVFTYPDESQLLIEDAYSGSCPCNIGTTCDRKEGVCRVPNASEDN